MLKKIVLSSIAACLTFVTACSYSLAAPKEYIIGVEDVSYFPYYAVQDNQYGGMIRDVLNSFAKKNGYRFVYRPLPIKRLHKAYLQGKVDFLYPDNPDWIVAQKEWITILYSEPVVTVLDGVMVLPEHKERGIQSLKVLGTILGYTAPAYEDLLQSKQVTLYERSDVDGVLKMAIANRTDGAYVTINTALYQLREVLHQPDALVFDATLPYDHANHSLSTIKHPVMIKQFNTFLAEEKDLLNSLKTKYKIIDNPDPHRN